jgi:hypothetical protein
MGYTDWLYNFQQWVKNPFDWEKDYYTERASQTEQELEEWAPYLQDNGALQTAINQTVEASVLPVNPVINTQVTGQYDQLLTAVAQAQALSQAIPAAVAQAQNQGRITSYEEPPGMMQQIMPGLTDEFISSLSSSLKKTLGIEPKYLLYGGLVILLLLTLFPEKENISSRRAR